MTKALKYSLDNLRISAFYLVKKKFLYCSLSQLEDVESHKIFFISIEGAPFIGAGTVHIRIFYKGNQNGQRTKI